MIKWEGETGAKRKGRSLTMQVSQISVINSYPKFHASLSTLRHSSRRPSMALARVTSSAYSRALPTGTP